MNIAFFGVGTMGAPMAQRLLSAGHTVTVYNRTVAKAEALRGHGARIADAPDRAVADAEVVISMLADPAAVSEVYRVALPALAPKAIVIDMSTVDPQTARTLDVQVRARNGAFLDAPVSGSRTPAEAGTLLILAGGDGETLERARPALEPMGRILHVGAVGQGMAAKLCLNGLGAHMLAGFCQMLVFGVKQGLSAGMLLEVFQSGAFSSPLYAQKGARILARDFSPDFSLALLKKDQELVLNTAAELAMPLPSEAAIVSIINEAVGAGLGAADLCALVQLFESRAGVTVR